MTNGDTIDEDFSGLDEMSAMSILIPCLMCGGCTIFMGCLGNADWFRCRDCDWKQSASMTLDDSDF